MLLEVVLVICDTEVTSADELIMKGRFNMVEFGEQLRSAQKSQGAFRRRESSLYAGENDARRQ